MAERPNKYQQYEQLSTNRQNTFKRMSGDAMVLATAGVIGLAGVDHHLTSFYLENKVIYGLYAVIAVSGIDALAHFIGNIRTNNRIALDIARTEGLDPKTPSEKRSAIRTATRVAEVVDKIGPTLGHLSDMEINHHWTRIQKRRNPLAAEERIIQDRKFTKMHVKAVEEDDAGRKLPTSVVIDSLNIANRQWNRIAEDEKQSHHRRRYARMMQDSIRGKLESELSNS